LDDLLLDPLTGTPSRVDLERDAEAAEPCGRSKLVCLVPLEWAARSPSNTHHKHLWTTKIDRVHWDSVNHPVPCKHKGTRGFPETFGND